MTSSVIVSPKDCCDNLRSSQTAISGEFCFARVMELVDIPDLKSGAYGRTGSSPVPSTSSEFLWTVPLDDQERDPLFERRSRQETTRD